MYHPAMETPSGYSVHPSLTPTIAGVPMIPDMHLLGQSYMTQNGRNRYPTVCLLSRPDCSLRYGWKRAD